MTPSCRTGIIPPAGAKAPATVTPCLVRALRTSPIGYAALRHRVLRHPLSPVRPGQGVRLERNQKYISGYFEKTRLAKAAPLMLGVLTVMEVGTGTLSALGVLQLLLVGKPAWPFGRRARDRELPRALLWPTDGQGLRRRRRDAALLPGGARGDVPHRPLASAAGLLDSRSSCCRLWACRSCTPSSAGSM